MGNKPAETVGWSDGRHLLVSACHSARDISGVINRSMVRFVVVLAL
jgi:hypothetical protein